MNISKITHLLKQKCTISLLVLVCVALILSMTFNLRCTKHRDHNLAMQTWVADTIFIKHLNDSKNYYDGLKEILAQHDRAAISQSYPGYVSDMVDTWQTTQEIAHRMILPTLTNDESSTVIINLDKMLMLQTKFLKEDPSDGDYQLYNVAVQNILNALNHKIINDEMKLLHLSLVE